MCSLSVLHYTWARRLEPSKYLVHYVCPRWWWNLGSKYCFNGAFRFWIQKHLSSANWCDNRNFIWAAKQKFDKIINLWKCMFFFIGYMVIIVKLIHPYSFSRSSIYHWIVWILEKIVDAFEFLPNFKFGFIRLVFS